MIVVPVRQSPDSNFWTGTVNDQGILTWSPGGSVLNNPTILGAPSGLYWQWAIDNNGLATLVNAGSTNDQPVLVSSGGIRWIVTVDDTDTNNAKVYLTGTPPVVPDFASDYPFILANNLGFKGTLGGPATAINAVDGKKYTMFQSPDTSACGITISAIPAAYQRALNILIVDGHNLSGVNVGIAYSDDGSNWYLFDSFTPSDNSRIIRRYTGQAAHGYYAFNMAASAGVKQISQVWFGEGVILEHPPIAPFDPDAEEWNYSDFVTESGVLLRYIRFIKRTLEMDLAYITPSMYANNINKIYSDFKIYGGFFWFCWRPQTDPTGFIYMACELQKRAFPFQGGLLRRGQFLAKEVLG